MADRTFTNTQAIDKGLVVISGSFKPAGTGAPTAVTGAGISSVVRNSAGSFTITLQDKYNSLRSAVATIAMSTPTDIKPQWGAIDVVTAKTLVLTTLAVATATDIAANAANVVYFTLVLKNSTV